MRAIARVMAGWMIALPMAIAAAPPAVVAPAAGVMVIFADATPALARRSSGGYSRPAFSRPRTPSFSGGYSRPRTPGFGLPTARTPSAGSGDRALSRRGSSEALEQFRRRSAPPGGVGSTGPRGTDFSAGRQGGGWAAPTWYDRRGWSAPRYALGGRRSFGMWDALFLWYLLDTVNRPGHAAFFYNHQNEAGYREWREEAERRAADDPALRAKLAELDQQLAAQQGTTRDSGYLPPDVPPEAAVAGTPRPAEDGGGVGTWLAVGLLGGTLAVLWQARRRRTAPLARSRPTHSPLEKEAPMTPLKTAAAILRGKVSGERYAPSLFRLGMTITMDPTPFLLAGDAVKVQAPRQEGTDMLVGVAAVGTVNAEGVKLYRLHLPDERSFLQLHLDDAGRPDECRFFSVIDEVAPADADEWAFWLDEADGMIGWPEFQTKDGKLYGRAWNPGSSRIAPRHLVETQETVCGMRIFATQAMLYAAPTGLAEPAPPAEYILVAAVEHEGQAWVRIAAGIDVNPASLSLA